MRIKIANINATPGEIFTDIFAIICVFIFGAFLSLAGVAAGYYHCSHNHCIGYEAVK